MSDKGTSQEVSKSNVHSARAMEFVQSQIVGIAAAIGAVWVGRSVAPTKLDHAAQAVEKIVQKYRPDFSPEYTHEYSRMIVNNAVMYAAGFTTTVTTAVGQARRRRDREGSDKDYSVGQDTRRVATGWLAGVAGSQTAWELANTFMRKGKGNNKAINNFIGDAEKALDKYAFNEVKIGANTKFSEAVVANLTMICGAIPSAVLAQDMYEQLIHDQSHSKDR
ncbi:MAG: hypothetical protein MRY32_01265 [Rickettsiales bacterium]|nr:hypothetical protein [Rickettsiales bacterium]